MVTPGSSTHRKLTQRQRPGTQVFSARKIGPLGIVAVAIAALELFAGAGCATTRPAVRFSADSTERCGGIGPTARRVIAAYERQKYTVVTIAAADDTHRRYADCAQALDDEDRGHVGVHAHEIGYARMRMFQSEYVYGMLSRRRGDVTTAREDFEHIVESVATGPHCYASGNDLLTEACPEYGREFDEVVNRANAQLASI